MASQDSDSERAVTKVWFYMLQELFVRSGLTISISALGISGLGGIICVPITLCLHKMTYGDPQNPGAWVFLYLYIPALFITIVVILVGILSFLLSIILIGLRLKRTK